jgi:quercetin dioxygenase-like cupin family protein
MAATLERTGRPAGGGRPVLGPREPATTRFFADQITVRHEGEVLDVWEAQVLAGCEPPAHAHAHHEEWLQVLEGSVRAWIGADEHRLRPGDVLYLPRGVPHRYEAVGREATLQVLASPGGVVELFRDLNRAFGAGGMPVVLAPSHRPVLDPVLARHGVSFAPTGASTA